MSNKRTKIFSDQQPHQSGDILETCYISAIKVGGIGREDFSAAFLSPSHEPRYGTTEYALTTSSSRFHYSQLISRT
jgi:hypothetical protein